MKDMLKAEYGSKHAEFEDFLQKSGIRSYRSVYWGDGALLVRYKERSHVYPKEFFDSWQNATWKQKQGILDDLRYSSKTEMMKARAKRRKARKKKGAKKA